MIPLLKIIANKDVISRKTNLKPKEIRICKGLLCFRFLPIAFAVFFIFCDGILHPLRAKEQISIWQESQPIFSDYPKEKRGLFFKEGALIWQHPLNARKSRKWAMQMAVPYSVSDMSKTLAREKFVLIAAPPNSEADLHRLLNQNNEFGLKYAVIAFYYDKKTRQKYPYILDPLFEQESLANIINYLPSLTHQIPFLFTGDEHIAEALIRGHDQLLKVNYIYPGLGDVDELVKREAGFGEYGVPDRGRWYNKFEAAAFTRWTLKRLRERQDRLRILSKSIAPETAIVSTDPMTGIYPYEYSLMSQYVDIFTHQTTIGNQLNRTLESALIVKLLRDLTAKEVWPCIHINRSTANNTPSPREVRDYLSILMLNGATGFHLYTADGYGKRNGLDTLNFYFGAPSRWKALLEALNLIRQKGIPTQPEADFAILYSNDNFQHKAAPGRRPESSNILKAYAIFGPVLRSWFEFIDEHRIIEGFLSPNKYRALIIPELTITRGDIIEPLLKYVREGGILVCMDPEAFSYGLDGSNIQWARRKLFGVEYNKEGNSQPMSFDVDSTRSDPKIQDAEHLDSPTEIVSLSQTRFISSIAKNSPMYVLREFGKGKTLFFYRNPLEFIILPKKKLPVKDLNMSEPVRSFFTSLLNELGISQNRPIWRFRLSPLKAEKPPNASDTCLTNNNVRWDKETPYFIYNYDTDGSYQLSRASRQTQAGTYVSFRGGRLTDRKMAVQSSALTNTEKWAEIWPKPGDLEILFDLKEDFSLTRMNIFFSGHIPPSFVRVSSDKSKWHMVGHNSAEDAGEDVQKVTYQLGGLRSRYVQVQFSKSDSSKPLILAETEIWGKIGDATFPLH